ncbi:transcriptional repressor [Rhodobacteraceae bacterium 2CG4]|uniref:Transcriptional repressor n=1 Tax=Halovulum marinum TaxID=2662447 RepID=A0A6L5Z4Q8_9RHOB|nr:Fur family transcriptional regulator [Halovulum marinum]MSU91012.1 transcriptional repressor [Halovulum marinum]
MTSAHDTGKRTGLEATAFAAHDHRACVARAAERLEADCARRNLRLTPVRRRVFEILAEAHRAVGAYDVLERLRDEGLGSQPPVAYRALDFLVAAGVVHRIHRLNAFIACAHRGAHRPAFLICRLCRRVEETELPPARAALDAAAAEAGFTLERSSIEAVGLCPDCAPEPA